MNERSFQIIRTIVRWICRTVTLVAMITFIYGIAMYPDGSIKKSNGRFLGKQGQFHTREEFEAYSNWEVALGLLWPAMFVMITIRYYVDPEWRKPTGTWKDF